MALTYLDESLEDECKEGIILKDFKHNDYINLEVEGLIYREEKPSLIGFPVLVWRLNLDLSSKLTKDILVFLKEVASSDLQLYINGFKAKQKMLKSIKESENIIKDEISIWNHKVDYYYNTGLHDDGWDKLFNISLRLIDSFVELITADSIRSLQSDILAYNNLYITRQEYGKGGQLDSLMTLYVIKGRLSYLNSLLDSLTDNIPSSTSESIDNVTSNIQYNHLFDWVKQLIVGNLNPRNAKDDSITKRLKAHFDVDFIASGAYTLDLVKADTPEAKNLVLYINNKVIEIDEDNESNNHTIQIHPDDKFINIDIEPYPDNEIGLAYDSYLSFYSDITEKKINLFLEECDDLDKIKFFAARNIQLLKMFGDKLYDYKRRIDNFEKLSVGESFERYLVSALQYYIPYFISLIQQRFYSFDSDIKVQSISELEAELFNISLNTDDFGFSFITCLPNTPEYQKLRDKLLHLTMLKTYPKITIPQILFCHYKQAALLYDNKEDILTTLKAAYKFWNEKLLSGEINVFVGDNFLIPSPNIKDRFLPMIKQEIDFIEGINDISRIDTSNIYLEIEAHIIFAQTYELNIEAAKKKIADTTKDKDLLLRGLLLHSLTFVRSQAINNKKAIKNKTFEELLEIETEKLKPIDLHIKSLLNKTDTLAVRPKNTFTSMFKGDESKALVLGTIEDLGYTKDQIWCGSSPSALRAFVNYFISTGDIKRFSEGEACKLLASNLGLTISRIPRKELQAYEDAEKEIRIYFK